MPKESVLVSKILKNLNALPNCKAIKTHGSIYQAGWPDIIGCYAGRFFAIEVKLLGGKPTKLQQAVLNDWKEADAKTGVATSIEEAINIVTIL